MALPLLFLVSSAILMPEEPTGENGKEEVSRHLVTSDYPVRKGCFLSSNQFNSRVLRSVLYSSHVWLL